MYLLHNFSPARLETYLALSHEFFQSAGASDQTIRAIFEKSPEAFYLLYAGDAPVGDNTPAVGIVCLLAITADTVKALEQNQINGAQFTPANVVRYQDACGCYYLGAVGAIGTEPRGATRELVLGKLLELKRGEIIRTYARPINPNGLRFLQRLNFVPTLPSSADPIDHIHVLQL